MALDIVITSIDEITNTSCTIHYTATKHISAWYDHDVIETPDDGYSAYFLVLYKVRLLSLESNTTYDVYIRGKENVGSDWENSNVDSFTTTNIGGGAPTKAKTPIPTNAADDVTLDQATITWEDGGGATSYDVYYGEDAGSLSLVSGGQTELSFSIDDIDYGSPFEYLISRTWRIDSINAVGVTTGDTWTFACIAFYPPLPSGVTLDEEGEPTGDPTGLNFMTAIRRLVAAAENKIWYEDI